MILQFFGSIVILCSLVTKNGLGLVCGLVMVLGAWFWGDNNFEK